MLVGPIGLAGCDGLLSPESRRGSGDVAFEIRNSGPPTNTGAKAGAEETPLRIEGEEGVLVVEELQFFLSKLRLSTGQKGEFRGGPKRNGSWIRNRLVDVPLDVTEEEALGMLEDLPEGTYYEVDVKIDGSEDGDEGDKLIPASWPEEATVMAAGRFEPANGDPARTFTVFLAAEARVHLELDPALEIVEGETPSVTVEFDPERLFRQLGEPSLDLSQYDGETLEVALNVKDSFEDVKFEMDVEDETGPEGGG